MKKRILAFCILLLFMTSTIIPITFGYNARTSVDTQKMKNLGPPIEDPPNEVWNNIFEKEGSETGRFVQQTYDGGYIIAGSTYTGQSDALLIKTDMDGNMLWEKTYGGPNLDCFHCLKETSDNGFIIIGGSNSYGWLVKTDENGMLL